MHLIQFKARMRLKFNSPPTAITTPWMRKPATLVISLAAFYQPSGVIGMVVDLQVGETLDPHRSNRSASGILCNYLIIKLHFLLYTSLIKLNCY
jgi:hypothetical protein